MSNILIETTGVVLIDEVDLHLHPTWQQRVLEDLTTIFPEIQFIVTTHAPEVINSAHSENLIILKDSQIQYTEYQIYGKDVKSVLHEVMGVNERPKKVAVLFQAFYENLDNGEFDQADQVLDQIDELRDYHDPEVAECRVKLRLEKMRRGKKYDRN